MTFEARSSARRCTITTSSANFVRKVASSMAESPPPTTITRLLRKNAASQVAQYETPRPCSLRSDSSPIWRAFAPVAMMTACAWCSWSPRKTLCGRLIGSSENSTRVTSSDTSCEPNRADCSRNLIISSGPMMPSGKPG